MRCKSRQKERGEDHHRIHEKASESKISIYKYRYIYICVYFDDMIHICIYIYFERNDTRVNHSDIYIYIPTRIAQQRVGEDDTDINTDISRVRDYTHGE